MMSSSPLLSFCCFSCDDRVFLKPWIRLLSVVRLTRYLVAMELIDAARLSVASCTARRKRSSRSLYCLSFVSVYIRPRGLFA